MQLTKTGYYADFVVYPTLVLALGWIGLRHAPSIERLEWMLACAVGAALWTLLEYLLHRHVLHRLAPFQRLHDLHHARSTALVGTPTWLSLCLFAGLALSIWHEADEDLASGLTAGLMLGYLCYVGVHHAVHHVKAHRGSWLHRAKLGTPCTTTPGIRAILASPQDCGTLPLVLPANLNRITRCKCPNQS